MVFLGINPAQTPVREGFTQSCNYNYSYVPNRVQANYFADYNKKYHNHFYRPYLPNEIKDDARLLEIKQKYTDVYNSYLNRKYIGMNR
jgi:hypothetical protein